MKLNTPSTPPTSPPAAKACAKSAPSTPSTPPSLFCDGVDIETYSVFRPTEPAYGGPCEQSELPPPPALPVYPKGALLDTVAFGNHKRATRAIMGLLVGNAKCTNVPASAHYFGYNLNFSEVPVNSCNALHTHKTHEIFMAFSGDFAISAGNGGHAKVPLPKYDMIIVPPLIKRSFKCVAKLEDTHPGLDLGRAEGIDASNCAHLITTLLGEPWVQWSPETVVAARKNGVRCTDAGLLYDAGTTPPKQEVKEEHDCTQEELESCVVRAEHGKQVEIPHGDGTVRFEWVELGGPAGAESWAADPTRSYCVLILRGDGVRIVSEDASAVEETKTVYLDQLAVVPRSAGRAGWRLERLANSVDGPVFIHLISANVSKHRLMG